MDNIEFNELVVHTDVSELPRLDDHTASQFISKMAGMGATVTFKYGKDLWLQAVTPIGTYSFMFPYEGQELEVMQVL